MMIGRTTCFTFYHSKRFTIETNTRVKVKVVWFVFGWRTGKIKLDCSFCTLAHGVTACIINSDKHSCFMRKRPNASRRGLGKWRAATLRRFEYIVSGS